MTSMEANQESELGAARGRQRAGVSRGGPGIFAAAFAEYPVEDPGMPPTADGTHTETQGVNLGDPRRTRTFARILGAVADAPDRSLAAPLGPGLRQAGHDLFASPRTSVPALLSGHVAHGEGGLMAAVFPQIHQALAHVALGVARFPEDLQRLKGGFRAQSGDEVLPGVGEVVEPGEREEPEIGQDETPAGQVGEELWGPRLLMLLGIGTEADLPPLLASQIEGAGQDARQQHRGPGGTPRSTASFRSKGSRTV
jgi:hypothetical protein